MKRLALILFFLAFAAFGSDEKLLQESTLSFTAKDSLHVQLFANAEQLKLKIGDGEPARLTTQGFAEIQGLHPSQHLEAQSFAFKDSPGALLTFGIVDGLGTVRSVAVVVIKKDAGWNVVHEWNVDSGSLGELGFRRETQKFAADPGGAVKREARKLMVEGVQGKLDCGCTVCNSRTTEVIDEEIWQWKPEGKLERVSLQKFYVVQQGEGLLAVARKALGDARLMTRLYRLNPELKDASALQPGQKILIERQ